MLVGFIVLYLLVNLAISFYISRRVKTSRDFMIAGGNVPMAVVGIMIFATWFSPEVIMGAPSLFLERGLKGAIVDVFGVFLCLVLIGLFFARKLYRLQVFTISDFFRLRYGKRMEAMSSLICVATFFSWIGAQFLALAYLFSTFAHIPTDWGIVLGATVIVIYTYAGGMRVISVADVLQMVVIIGGLLFVMVNLLAKTEGLITVLANTPKGFYDFLPQPGFYNWVDYLGLWMTYGLAAIPTQEIYQQVLSARSENAGARGVFVGGAILFLVSTIPLTIALCISQLYPQWLADNQGENMIPSSIASHEGMLLQVVFFGAFTSAILSTGSGALLAPATVVAENIIKPRFKNLSDAKLLRFTRLSVVFVALISASTAFWRGSVHVLVVDSVKLLLVCLLVPFTLGLYWKRASVVGAWAAIIFGGLAWLVSTTYGTRIHPSMVGLVASLVSMIMGSLMKPDDSYTSYFKASFGRSAASKVEA